MLDAVEVSTGPAPTAAVVWLHGLGADGWDFEPIVAELDLPPAVRFVFPHAPVRPVTINGGMAMRAWYDIYGLGPGGPEDEAGIRASAVLVAELIERERARGIAAERIVLAGFSQGGAIALHLGVRAEQRCAGVLALSTYLPLASSLGREGSAAGREIPIWMAHGADDAVIGLRFAEASCALLRGHGCRVDWHAYPMGHAVCQAEIRDLDSWLKERLG